MIPPPPANTRQPFDPLVLREKVIQNAKEQFGKKLNTLEVSNMKLHVTDLEVKHRDFSTKEQKEQILNKESLTVPLRGKIDLIHKETGQVLDSKKTVIQHIPWITERNTQIIQGSEYIPIFQARLKAGVYHRIKDSGEAEAHVNVVPGTGLGGRVVFFPDKELFVYMVQNTQIKLYGLLRGLGVSDFEMQSAWGKEIFDKNKAAFGGDEVSKLYDKVFNR